MLFYVLLLVLSCYVSQSQAKHVPYHYPSGSEHSAVSLNNAPVGLYGKTSNAYGGSEEFAVSLGGAEVGVYGRRSRQQQAPYVPAVPWYYWPMPYSLEWDPYSSFYNSIYSYGPPVNTVADSYLPGIAPRNFQGSIASAKATADSVREKSSAEASSFQGKIPPEMLSGFLDF